MTVQQCTRSQTAPSQRSFDISVNVLNGLSDKLLLSDKLKTKNSEAGKAPEAGKPSEQSKQQDAAKNSDKTQAEQALLAIAQSISPPTLPCRPQEIPLEVSLLTVPISCLLAGVVLYGRNSHDALVCTIASCFIVLATPAFLLVAHSMIKKHMYVHLLLIHEAALFVILHKRFVTLQCIVFVVVFAHLSVHQAAGKPLLFFVAVANAAAIIVFENAVQFPTTTGVDTLCGSIVLCSALVYASYVTHAFWKSP